MLRIAFLIVLTSASAGAETVSDAFGILPASALSEQRAAWAGSREGREPDLGVPDKASAILLFIGPKSLVAGKDYGHAVALAFDQHGNLAQQGDANFRLPEISRSAPLADGIAEILFMPEPTAGTFTGGASIGGFQSARALYRVVADVDSVWPTLIETDALVSENYSVLSTDDLVDQYGNPVEDGVGTMFLLKHADGTTSQMSPTIREASAEATFLVRDVSSGGALEASLGINSEISLFDYEEITLEEPIGMRLWTDESLNATAFRIGPIGTSEGHLLNDGVPVTLTISAEGASLQETGWIQDGYFASTTPLPPSFDQAELKLSTPFGKVTQFVPLSDAPEKVRGAE